MHKFDCGVDSSTGEFGEFDGAISVDQAKWFVIWACLWVAALAVLLPALP